MPTLQNLLDFSEHAMKYLYTLAPGLGMPCAWVLSHPKQTPTQPYWIFSDYPLQIHLPPFFNQPWESDIYGQHQLSPLVLWLLVGSADERVEGDKGQDVRGCTPPPDATGGFPQ